MAATDPAPHEVLLAAPWRTAAASLHLLDALEARGRPARFVGGCVRDSLAGRVRAAWDLDLATPERPLVVLDLLAEADIKAVPTGLAHGTVTAIIGAQPFEITTLRRDAATDGRHAVVAFTDDFAEDAARRDFTCNAMSCDRQGRLFDPFGGIADLKAGVVRFVGVPAERIAEDYLRVLRYFRFYASFGIAAPDGDTCKALRAGSDGLDRLSGERVRQETLKLLAVPDPRAAVRLMDEIGVLAWLLRTTPKLELFEALVASDPSADPLDRLAALVRASEADPKTLAARLKLANAEAERLVARLDARPLDPPTVDDAELRRRLVEQGAGAVTALGLQSLAAAGAGQAAAAAWRRRVAATAVPVFPLAGRDVLALGVPAGPAVGLLLRRVEAWWRDNGCTADRDQALAQLRAAIKGER